MSTPVQRPLVSKYSNFSIENILRQSEDRDTKCRPDVDLKQLILHQSYQAEGLEALCRATSLRNAKQVRPDSDTCQTKWVSGLSTAQDNDPITTAAVWLGPRATAGQVTAAVGWTGTRATAGQITTAASWTGQCVAAGQATTAAGWTGQCVTAGQVTTAGLLLPFAAPGQELSRPQLLLTDGSSSSSIFAAAMTADDFPSLCDQQLTARNFVASLQASGMFHVV